MKFIRKETLEFTGDYDCWDLAGFTAVVMGANEIVSIDVEKHSIDYTEKILIQLQADKKFSYITKGLGIDAVFIECPKDKLEEVLTKIEEICTTL